MQRNSKGAPVPRLPQRAALTLRAFLAGDQAEILRRCMARLARRHSQDASHERLESELAEFLQQLERNLRDDEAGEERVRNLQPPGMPPGDSDAEGSHRPGTSDRGRRLMALGCSIGQVVQDYGDLSETITEIALERGAPITLSQYRTLSRCIDTAIVDAVSQFGLRHAAGPVRNWPDAGDERVGALAHELRNALLTATLALSALEQNGEPVTARNGSVLKRSIQDMKRLVRAAMEDVRKVHAAEPNAFTLSEFILEASDAARLAANEKAVDFEVETAIPAVRVAGHRAPLLGVLGNLLQNAFKFTRPGTRVTLQARQHDRTVAIEVADHCGGLPHGDPARLFAAFAQHSTDRSGLGLGLSIALRTVQAEGGHLTVRDLPGVGCVFTLGLPLAGVEPLSG